MCRPTNQLVGFGVYEGNDRVFLFRKSLKDTKKFLVSFSFDGIEFESFGKGYIQDTTKFDLSTLSDFRLTRFGEQYFMVYLEDNKGLSLAQASDIFNWKYVASLPIKYNSALMIPDKRCGGDYCFLVSDGKNIRLAKTKEFLSWKNLPKILIESTSDTINITLGSLIELDDEYLVSYYKEVKDKAGSDLTIKMMLMSKDSGYKKLWKKPKTLWHRNSQWEGDEIYPLGISRVNDRFVSYWESANQEIFAFDHIPHTKIRKMPQAGYKEPSLKRFSKNPTLRPVSDNPWESYAVFNPAAVYDRGRVHLLYRAVGNNGSSVWGYASSDDGFNFQTRECPVYVPREGFEVNDGKSCSLKYFSGGVGMGGCEDPRITKIDGKFYVTYTAFDGRTAPKMTVTSITEDDFHNQKWSKWAKPVVMSKPNEAHKNWVMFPEKINGKFAILHSLTPKILIDYFDDLLFSDGRQIDSRYQLQHNENQWDSTIRSAGPPPIRVNDGWLVFYHAMDHKDPGKYKIGAMVLDHDDPTKILYKSKCPVLEPIEDYETGGIKGNIVYTNGATVVGNDLFVYYGASDNTVNVAYEYLPSFLDKVKHHGYVKMKTLKKRSSHKAHKAM